MRNLWNNHHLFLLWMSVALSNVIGTHGLHRFESYAFED
jgi:hypothetical protein